MGKQLLRGVFSVNKEILVENLQELSLVSQRRVADYVQYIDKPIWEIPLPNDLLKSCKQAYSHYFAALEKKKTEKAENEKDLKRKLKREEIAAVGEKRRALESTIRSLESDIESYSIAAEKENKMELLIKANAFRDKVKDKKKTLSDLDIVITKLREEENKF